MAVCLRSSRMSESMMSFRLGTPVDFRITSDEKSADPAGVKGSLTQAVTVVAPGGRPPSGATLTGVPPPCILSPPPAYSTTPLGRFRFCLLYTSDAADEEDSVDLGGRRIIKK